MIGLYWRFKTSAMGNHLAKINCGELSDMAKLCQINLVFPRLVGGELRSNQIQFE